jgi:hypothetical protein
MVVEAVLVVNQHKAWVTRSGDHFGECVEFRLMRTARIVRKSGRCGKRARRC